MTAVLWLLAGAVAGAALTFGVGLLILTYGNVPQAQGGAAMGLIFFFTPAGALIGAVLGLIGGLMSRRRR